MQDVFVEVCESTFDIIINSIFLDTFAEKEGKAFHLGYDHKCRLLAYTQQVSHGPYDSAAHGSAVGVLDVVGKDRRVAWQKLGADLTRQSAMLAFVSELNEACPLLAPCVEAHRKDVEMRAERARAEEERRILDRQRKEAEVRSTIARERNNRNILITNETFGIGGARSAEAPGVGRAGGEAKTDQRSPQSPDVRTI